MSIALHQHTGSVREMAGGFFASVISSIREIHARHQAVADLSCMSDRELSDIGITRYDIGRIGRGESVGN
jgi:uncharacterized protein YjiS (DUF1127 family)